jgi:hypothetical protein
LSLERITGKPSQTRNYSASKFFENHQNQTQNCQNHIMMIQ